MSELVVVGFKNDISRASAVLNELRTRDDAWTAHLHGAIAIYRTAKGELTLDEAYESTKGGDTIGTGMLGALIGIAVAAVALPITAAASVAVVAGSFVAGAIGGSIIGSHHGVAEYAAWWKHDLGVSEEFLGAMQAMVQPGDSAIVILVRERAPTDFVERFRPYGGTVLQSTLSPDQTAKVHAKLGLTS